MSTSQNRFWSPIVPNRDISVYNLFASSLRIARSGPSPSKEQSLNRSSHLTMVANRSALPWGDPAVSNFPPEKRHARRSGPAKRLELEQIQRVMRFVIEHSKIPEADLVKFMLSVFAGLRSREIALLRVEDVTDAAGNIAPAITIPASISKNGRSRKVPVDPRLAEAIRRFRVRHPQATQFALSPQDPSRVQDPPTLCTWFWRLYDRVGLKKCSSHSGRRTFITNAARALGGTSCSLRDVQLMVGHARLDTTAMYIDESERHAELIAAMNAPRDNWLNSLIGEAV